MHRVLQWRIQRRQVLPRSGTDLLERRAVLLGCLRGDLLHAQLSSVPRRKLPHRYGPPASVLAGGAAYSIRRCVAIAAPAGTEAVTDRIDMGIAGRTGYSCAEAVSVPARANTRSKARRRLSRMARLAGIDGSRG